MVLSWPWQLQAVSGAGSVERMCLSLPVCVECEELSWCPGPAAGGLVPARRQQVDPIAGRWLTPTVPVAAGQPGGRAFLSSHRHISLWAYLQPSATTWGSSAPQPALLPLRVASGEPWLRCCAVPWLTKPACPLLLPANSPSHPGQLSPLPAPGPCLCFGHRGASQAVWAAGTLPAHVILPGFVL